MGNWMEKKPGSICHSNGTMLFFALASLHFVFVNYDRIRKKATYKWVLVLEKKTRSASEQRECTI